MARRCGCCGLAPREGEEMFPIRLTADDLPHTPAVEEGLYGACIECTEQHRKRVAERTGKELAEVTNRDMC